MKTQFSVASTPKHNRLVVEVECVDGKIYSLLRLTKEGEPVVAEFDLSSQGGPVFEMVLDEFLELLEAGRAELVKSYGK